MATENAKQIEIRDFNLNGDVIVKAHPDTGAIYTVKNNPEWCSIRVESLMLGNNEKGLLALQKRVAFIRMQVAVANLLIAQGQLKPDKPFPFKGKIVIKESLVEFHSGQVPKVNPATGEIIEYAGYPVYRATYFQSGESAHDELITDWVKRQAAKVQTVEEEAVEQLPFEVEEIIQKEFAA